MKPETKLWHELKRITPQITWTRLENTSVLGSPDLLGYNNNQHFFTVELKITSANKIRFSPHQISFHVLHPKNTFILAKKPSQGSCKLFPGTCILALVKEGFKCEDACCLSLDACGLFLSSLGAWCLSLAACCLKLSVLAACRSSGLMLEDFLLVIQLTVLNFSSYSQIFPSI